MNAGPNGSNTAGTLPPRRIRTHRTSANAMFEPFFTTKAEGLGMGLPICRTIIESHGGTIAAERCEGGGLRVGFGLPGGLS